MQSEIHDACCCARVKKRTPEEVQALTHRLNRVEGQIHGLRAMLEKDAYCPDILTQVAAATAALQSFGRELLASHIRSCVVEDIRAGKEGAADELIATLQKFLK